MLSFNYIKRAAMLFTASVLALTAIAQQPSLQVKAPGQVVQGNRFTVTFRFTNAEGAVRTAPEIKNCELLFGPGVSTMVSSSYTPQGSSTVEITDYTFTYQAVKAGTVTIPAISVNSGGRKLSTKAHQITILTPDRSQQQQQQTGNGGGEVISRQQSVSPNDLIVDVSLNKSRIYEGEAVIATIKVYTKLGISTFQATKLPQYNGFLSEELPVSNQQVQIEKFRGDNYYSLVLKRVLLFPKTADDKLTINSGTYDVTVLTYENISNGFMVTRREVPHHITTKSNTVTVNVTPLPKGAPSGFNGAVGDYRATATLEPSLLRTNEAATYTLKITGTGNVNYLTAPKIDFGIGVEQYEPEAQADASFNGQTLSGSFTASYTLVPTQTGTLDIPTQQFVYFSPADGKYHTVDLPAIQRKVIKGNENAAAPVQKIDKLDDILHIRRLSSDNLKPETHRVLFTTIYLLCYLIVIAALVTAAIVYRRNIKLNADVQGRRMARAHRVAAKRLKKAGTMLRQQNYEGFYNALSAAMWGYLSDKLRMPGSELTRDNISDRLAATGIDNALTDKVIYILDECEMARFTPQDSNAQATTLYDEASSVIRDIENTSNRKKSVQK